MRRIDIFVSSPADVQKERSLVERLIRSVAAEFNVPVTVSYSNWLRRLSPSDKATALSANGFEEGRSLLCPCFWEYQDFKSEQEYRERIPNTGQYDLVICILWSRLGTKISPGFVMPDGSQPTSATEYEIAWVLDQMTRTPGFPELHVYRNRSTPVTPSEPKDEREITFEHWDSVQDFFATWGRGEAFANACDDYSDLQEFEELFREHFRAFVKQQLEREIIPRRHWQRAPYWKLNPYRGLQSFDYEHAAIFHGRTKAIGHVLDALKKQAIAKKPFVLVLGAKGSGKSSLVRAGVLPFLTEVGAANGPWRRAVTRPGPVDTAGDPFRRLAAALVVDSALPELEHAASHNGRGDLASRLREHPDDVAVQLAEVLDQISLQELDRLLDGEAGEFPLPGRIEGTELARHRTLRRAKPKAHLALVVDQLEDLFTGGYSAGLQRQYLAALIALIRCQRVFVIATLQSDFYANYQQFPELTQLVGASGRFDLQPPTREEIGYMIRLPAAAAGLRFERDLRSGRGLDEALLDAALACSDPLPLLEHVLSQLYRQQLERKDGLLRWSDYRDRGELEGALAHHAEAVFTQLGSDEQGAFDFVMRHLVSLGRGETGTGRAVRYRELVSSPEFAQWQKAGAKGLVDCFIKEELFSAEACSNQEMIVSITHEALLRKWPRFQLWLAEDQGFLRMRDRLDANLKLWLSRDRRCEDLLGPAFGVADAATLLRHFRSALNKTETEYIEKILAKQKHGRRRNTALSVIGTGVAVLAIVASILWFNKDSHQKRADELARFERRMEELAKEQSGVQENQVRKAKEKAQIDAQNADFSGAQGSALEAQLALENELKQAQEKTETAQKNAELAAAQRTALEAELKKAQDKAQLAQQNADLATTRRAAMEAELKKTQDNAQLTNQKPDHATTQRAAKES
jgi:ketosteroid isomerase-like protein